MHTIDWLKKNAPGFQELTDAERQEMTGFFFLWSLFEAEVLNCQANASAIVEVSKRWHENGLLTGETFGQELAYFRERYVDDEELSNRFNYLRLPRYGDPERLLVEEVLKGRDGQSANIAAAVLIIAYRYRNNLIHGGKWSYDLREQLENFKHANSALIRAMELHREVSSGAQE